MAIKNNYIIVDTETGGLDPDKHSLLTLGFIFVKGDKVVTEVEFSVSKDEYHVQPRAMEVNKLNLTYLQNYGYKVDVIKKRFASLVKDIYGDDKPTFVGQNVHFDIGFIYKQLMPKDELDKICHYRLIDTACIAGLLKDVGLVPSTSLSDLAEYFNCGSDDHEDRHTCLYDARITWEVYKNMRDKIKGLIH